MFNLLLVAILLTLPQLDKLDDIGILRFIYPNQSFVSGEGTQVPGQRYQVGGIETHRAAVLSRVIGKFTQPDTTEMLAIIGVDTGDEKTVVVPTGLYAVLLRPDKQGTPQLVARVAALQKRFSPFGSKYWRPVYVTDIDFDKQDELIMLEGETRTGNERYQIFQWKGKEFVPVTDHPALALLNFYAHLDRGARLAARESEEAAKPQFEAALAELSPKMQGQQSVDTLRRRVQEAKAVEINALKVMIKGEASALIRLQYRLVGDSGSERLFEADYQVRRFNERWQLDTERLKAATPPAATQN